MGEAKRKALNFRTRPEAVGREGTPSRPLLFLMSLLLG